MSLFLFMKISIYFYKIQCYNKINKSISYGGIKMFLERYTDRDLKVLTIEDHTADNLLSGS